MSSQPGDPVLVPESTAVTITGGTAADRDELRRQLSAAGMSLPIETTPDPIDVADRGSAPVGIVRLTTSADGGAPRLPEGADGSDTPVIAIGSGVDVAAAYEAGVSQVIPLDVSALPDAAIERIADRFRQTAARRVSADLLEQAPLGAAVFAPETGEVVGYTDRCPTLIGCDRSAEGIGLPALAACCDHTEADLLDLIRRAASGESTTVEFHDLPDDAPADCLELTVESATLGGDEFVVGWLRDVTERTEWREERQRYRKILESLDDAVYAMAPDGTLEYVNEKYASMKGVDRETLLGTNIYEWVDEEPAERAKEIRRQLRAGEREAGRLEYDFRAADGDTTPAEIRFVTMADDSDAVGGAGVIRDISDQKSYERRLERQNERLEEFASIVSHDLRNPLSVADGRLELVREECDSEHLDAVADAHDRMAELIDDLLTLAREGDDVRELDAVDLASLVESCWTTVETGNATIDIDVDRPIRADPSRLRQVVENLLRNAVEHAGDDVAVAVGALDDGDGFYLADDGPGIPAEQRETVFDVGHSTNPDGTGFGLSIVEQVADAHGWTVTLTESESGGARFEFSGVTFPSE